MIYLDNAATSFPKPDEVYDGVIWAMKESGVSANRGSYRKAIEASRYIYETRRIIADLFNIEDEGRIAFTKNATEAINIAIKSCLSKGEHVLISSLEHNSVYRCIYKLHKTGVIDYDIVWVNNNKDIDPRQFEKKIKDNTKAIICTHSSNVLGNILPIMEIGKTAKKNNLLMIVDAAQTAGVIPIDVRRDNIDILCFTGHKHLFGPQGTGGIYAKKGLEINGLIEGGTGGYANKLIIDEFPDKIETGTLNFPGIFGLHEGIRFINKIGIGNIRNHEKKLMKILYEDLNELKDISIYGINDFSKKTGVISFNIGDMYCNEVGYKLDKYYNIMVRTGLHCSPLAHKSIGTFNNGTVRVSIGYFNRVEDIKKLVTALQGIKRGEI